MILLPWILVMAIDVFASINSSSELTSVVLSLKMACPVGERREIVLPC